MKRKFDFAVGEYYHIYSRGTDKRTIFLDDKDRQRFIDLLYLCNGHKSIVMRDITRPHNYKGRSSVKVNNIFEFEKGDPLVGIGAYCLMPNHFHLILFEKEEGGISAFMKKLLTAYSSYFNLKHERKGGLFEGRFKATHIGSDEYFEYLFAYIHLNPIKIIEPTWKSAGIQNPENAMLFLNSYKFSSYLDYVAGDRGQAKILSKNLFPEYFSTPKEHKDFVEFWLKYGEQFTEDRPL